MDNEIIKIDKTDLAFAQQMCSEIIDDTLKNRAIANITAVRTASKYFSTEIYDVDTSSGLCNTGKSAKSIDIADLYIDNKYIDVRIYFNGSTPTVPIFNIENNIVPAAYMFIKCSENLETAEVAGFMLPQDVKNCKSDKNYYNISEDELNSFYAIESKLKNIESDDIDMSEAELFDLIHNNSIDEITLYKMLIPSQQLRSLYVKTVQLQSVFDRMSTDSGDENNNQAQDNIDDLFLELSDKNDNIDGFETVVTPNIEEIEFTDNNNNKNNDAEQIENNAENEINNLFDSYEEENSELNDANSEDVITENTKKKKTVSPTLILLLAILLLGGIGYYAFTIFNSGTSGAKTEPVQQNRIETTAQNQQNTQTSDNMPNENVENIEPTNNKEEGNAINIPAIEKNLDASILVSNLKVDWEVPAGYASNTAAKRYLIKLGKIVQLNLKTELLLLSKPPITNVIAVELRYNNNNKKFETVGITTSSGEKSVDDLILRTINNALNIHFNTNTESFSKLSGNPVLMIKL